MTVEKFIGRVVAGAYILLLYIWNCGTVWVIDVSRQKCGYKNVKLQLVTVSRDYLYTYSPDCEPLTRTCFILCAFLRFLNCSFLSNSFHTEFARFSLFTILFRNDFQHYFRHIWPFVSSHHKHKQDFGSCFRSIVVLREL